jgi:uncharacterized protein YbjT (DUF2867 family)
MKVIITGATGMVGEGVLLECLQNDLVSKILVVGRKTCSMSHPKLSELIVPDFLKIGDFASELTGYDACFFCAGISSVGLKEPEYTVITYDTTLAFAKTLIALNSNLVFNFVSGQATDSSEKGRSMWARVKGKTENDLMKLGFKGQFNFRPGAMTPMTGQTRAKTLYTIIANVANFLVPKMVLNIQDIGKAMIHSVAYGYPKQVLEVADIRVLAKKTS